ncbi:peptide deformylase [Clostridia bacterium]|nr:peptide deformylase [Clostridia bacterium]
MGIRKLTNWDDEMFRKVSRPVEKFDDRLHRLLDDMRDTLVSVGGYGCAAAHVGILRRAVVILPDESEGRAEIIEFVNPTLRVTGTETQCVLEGSVAPGAVWGYVDRPYEVEVAAFDRNGGAVTIHGTGFLAATLCHEIEVLDGVKFSDNVTEFVDESKVSLL